MLYYDIPGSKSVTVCLATPPDARDSQQLPLKPGSFSRQVLRWNGRERTTHSSLKLCLRCSSDPHILRLNRSSLYRGASVF